MVGQVQQMQNASWQMQHGQGGTAAPNAAFNQLAAAGAQLLPANTPVPQNLQPSNAPTPSSNRLLPQQLPPRATATPMQIPNTPALNGAAASPGVRQGLAGSPSGRPDTHVPPGMNGVGGPHVQMPVRPMPALPQQTFSQAFNTWRQRHNINFDDHALRVDGKPVDWHGLHREVLNLGGPQRVRLSFLASSVPVS